jgi:hypothetical protein
MPSSAHSRSSRAALLATLVVAAATPRRSAAQEQAPERPIWLAAPSRTWLEATTGTVLEEYLRALQLDTARSRSYPQTVRGYAPSEVQAMLRGGAGPWDRAVGSRRRARVELVLLRPGANTVVNSTFPFGLDDGAMWAGRGLSAALDVGAYLVVGPLSVRVQPVLVWSQNATFRLFDAQRPGGARFHDPIAPFEIDTPERFGDTPWHRLDYGESEVRLDLLGLAAGLSNARQSWGPATTHPLVLGPNAPGFAHLFVGTARPLSIGIGRLHGRIISGRLDQSEWSPTPDSLARRLGAGLALSFMPRGTTGLEIGGTRFFHRRWTGGEASWRGLSVPFTGYLFKQQSIGTDDPESPNFDPDNQLASLFVRWAPAGARTELYGEYARNDASLNAREIVTEPDHQSAYTLGARRLIEGRPARLRLVRAEWVNARATHIDRVRPQGLLYTHNIFTQGHTNQGKVLGSVAVPGGGGFVVGFDEYDARGVRTIELHRLGRIAAIGEGAPSADSVDVQYALSYRRTRLTGRLDVTTGATTVWELNRDFRRDAFNLAVQVGVRFGARRVAEAAP